MSNLEPANKSKVSKFATEIRPNAIWDGFKWLGGALMQTSIASGFLLYLTAISLSWFIVVGLFVISLAFMAIPYFLSRRKASFDLIKLEQPTTLLEQEKIKQLVETSEKKSLEKIKELEAQNLLYEEKIKNIEAKFKFDTDKPLTKVIGRKFANEKVILDGHHYIKCEFFNVTFVYNGTAYADFSENIIGGCIISSENVAISVAYVIAYGMGYIKPEFPLYDAESREPLKHVKPPTYE